MTPPTRSTASLGRRLAWIPAALALVLTLLFVLVCDALLHRHQLRQAGEQAHALAGDLARELALDLDQRLAGIQLLARSAALREPIDAAALRDELDGARSLMPGFAWLGLVDAEGRVHASTSADETSAAEADFERLRRQGGPLADERPGRGWLLPGGASGLVDLVFPLPTERGAGLRLLGARLDRAWADGRRGRGLEQNPGTELLVLADDGRLLLGPRSGGTAVPAEALRAAGEAARRVVDPSGGAWLLAADPLPGRAGRDLGWRVVAQVPEALVLRPLRELQAGLAVGGLVVAGVLAALAIVWTRRLTGPYEGLLAAVSERHRIESAERSRPTGLTSYLDEVTHQLARLAPAVPPRPAAGAGGELLSADAAIALLARDATRLRQVLDGLPLGVALADERGALVYWNAGCERLFGWHADEVLGRPARGLVVAETPAETSGRHDLLRPPGEPATQRLTRNRKDGASVWCEVQSLPMSAPPAGSGGWLLLVRDLTDERRALAQAHEVEQQRAAMAEAAVDWVFARLDASAHLAQWTPAALTVFGQSEAQWQGRSIDVLFPFEDVERRLPCELISRADAEGRVEHEGWLYRQGGGRFWGNLLLYRLKRDDGALAGFTLVARDLSERRAVEERLRESESRLAAIFDSASDAVISTDVFGQVLLFNPAAERIFGWSAAQIVGQPLERLLPERHRDAARRELLDFVASPLAQRPVGDGGKVSGLRADGSEVRLEGSISQTTVNSHKVLTAILRDVTERVRAERALMDYQFQLSALAQRLMASEQDTNRRVAQALHDQLGQTLTALRLVFDALQAALPEPALASTERVRGRLAELIDRSLREVRRVLVELRPALLQEMGLAAAIDNEVRNQSREARDVALVFEPEPTCVGRRWPPDVEYAAFMVAREALGNAIRHSQASVVHVRLAHGMPDLKLEVHDDGTGMGEDQHRIKPGHLGLVGMRERALAIGAQLRLQSASAEGTTITLDWSPAS